MDASVKNSEVPPEEISGSGMPFVGTSESTTLMLKNACSRMVVVMPKATRRRNGSRRAEGGAQAAHAEDHEQQHDEHGADEAQLLGDVGEDEIGGGFGQIEELLHAFHVAAAGEAAGAHGDERLVDVEAGALRIGGGIEEGEHARPAPGNQKSSAARPAEPPAQRRPGTSTPCPARMSIMAVTPARTSAVPRSGWLTTSSIKTTGTTAARESVCQSRIGSSRLCRNQARKRTSTGLAISDG